MNKQLIITPESQFDIDETYEWYEKQLKGLGKEFINCLDTKLSNIKQDPHLYQIIYKKKVRRALLTRFPYSIYFVDEPEMMTVIAIIHQSRKSDIWKSRT